MYLAANDHNFNSVSICINRSTPSIVDGVDPCLLLSFARKMEHCVLMGCIVLYCTVVLYRIVSI